jgi:hypothetical protein
VPFGISLVVSVTVTVYCPSAMYQSKPEASVTATNETYDEGAKAGVGSLIVYYLWQDYVEAFIVIVSEVLTTLPSTLTVRIDMVNVSAPSAIESSLGVIEKLPMP